MKWKGICVVKNKSRLGKTGADWAIAYLV